MKIIVKNLGAIVSETPIEAGQEYVIGRDSSCQIIIDGQRGISRQHARLVWDGTSWVVSLISKFGTLVTEGQTADAIALEPGSSFSIPPFEFQLVAEAQDAVPAQESEADASPEEVAAKSPNSLVPRAMVNPTPTNAFSQEHTSIVQTSASPFLRVVFKANKREEVFRLEGNAWTIGREPGCEIQIDDSHISRRHLELAKTSSGFFITDLGSANGSELNGEELTANEPIQIVSGDIVSIRSIDLHFELRDSQFEKRLMQIPQAPMMIPLEALDQFPAPSHGYQLPAEYQGPAVVKVDQPGIQLGGLRIPHPRHMNRQQKVRAVILVLGLVLLFNYLLGGEEQKKEQASTAGEAMKFDNLTPEQKTSVKDAFMLAQNLYVQGKYELCTAELKKVHDVIPFYDNSKELETFCAQGAELLRKKQEMERLRAQQEVNDQFVRAEVERCRAVLKTSVSIDEANSCLAAAIERDPQNSAIVALQNEIQEKQMMAKLKQSQVEEVRARLARLRRIVEQARTLKQKNQLSKAIDVYETYLGKVRSSELVDLTQDVRREVASVKSDLSAKVGSLLHTCKQNLEQNKYKAAYLDCHAATKEDPGHSEAKALKTKALSELKRELKALYEDSVLEESLGNVDQAKEKWRKLMEDDLPDGEYAVKAKSKLRKYGIGM